MALRNRELHARNDDDDVYRSNTAFIIVFAKTDIKLYASYRIFGNKIMQYFMINVKNFYAVVWLWPYSLHTWELKQLLEQKLVR